MTGVEEPEEFSAERRFVQAATQEYPNRHEISVHGEELWLCDQDSNVFINITAGLRAANSFEVEPSHPKAPYEMSVEELEQLPINDAPTHTPDGHEVSVWDCMSGAKTPNWRTFTDSAGKLWDVGSSGGVWMRRAFGAE